MPDLDKSFWYCLAHSRVETYEQSDSPDRLGPYSSASEAADALKTIAARNEQYDRQDAKWEDE